jgi:hypothetical protein
MWLHSITSIYNHCPKFRNLATPSCNVVAKVFDFLPNLQLLSHSVTVSWMLAEDKRVLGIYLIMAQHTKNTSIFVGLPSSPKSQGNDAMVQMKAQTCNGVHYRRILNLGKPNIITITHSDKETYLDYAHCFKINLLILNKAVGGGRKTVGNPYSF